MTKLLMVATVPVTFEAFLMPFARHFRARGWTVDGMAAGLPDSPAAEGLDRAWDAAWSRNPLEPSNLRSARGIAKIVAAQRYDLVHVHTPVAGFVTRWALRRRPPEVRLAYTAHGFHFAPGLHPLRNAVFFGIESLACRWTDELVVINSDDAEVARRHHMLPPERVRLVPGIGVDVERFDRASVPAQDVREVRERLGLGPETPLLTMVAEFTPNKRHAHVLRALARAREPVHVAFAGDGPTLEASRRLAAGLGVAGRAHFLGWCEDVRPLVAASAATVLFSAREGLPRSSMESLAMEVPVIGADVRGLRDLLGEGAGVLVPAGDVGALASAIDELVRDPAGAAGMGREGRRMMCGRYSLRAILAEYDALYADMLAAREGAAPTA
ncbi:MAG TPA: glycosyltransferase family 4 protein [Coriobacteriia bacterium]|jgi:glycosyltransferase involved in cell wall biosynthesis